MADNEPMTDEQFQTVSNWLASGHRVPTQAQVTAIMRALDEIERLRAALEREQNEHANCEDVNAQRFQTLTDTIIALTQQVTAMRPMVEEVASAVVLTRGAMPDVIKRAVMFTPERSIKNLQEEARAFIAAHPAGEAS